MEAIISYLGKNSEYYQEIPQSQIADKPMAREEEPHNNQETPGRQTEQPALFSPSKIATLQKDVTYSEWCIESNTSS